MLVISLNTGVLINIKKLGLWNNPVYSWGKRHVYLALNINHNSSKFVSTLVVFLISAVLHEVMIGIPTKLLNGVAFMGMMGQIPLILFMEAVGNLQQRAFPRSKDW
jgi:diacylglycerol O-acyltransferase-1